MYNKDNKVELILVRRETSPEDLRGMKVAKGILTAFGGASSHAALVSRQMGKVCIVGAGELQIDYQAGTVKVGTRPSRKVTTSASTDSPVKSSQGKVQTKPSEVSRC
jgi:pyruvate,orthophosphate dikinase